MCSDIWVFAVFVSTPHLICSFFLFSYKGVCVYIYGQCAHLLICYVVNFVRNFKHQERFLCLYISEMLGGSSYVNFCLQFLFLLLLAVVFSCIGLYCFGYSLTVAV